VGDTKQILTFYPYIILECHRFERAVDIQIRYVSCILGTASVLKNLTKLLQEIQGNLTQKFHNTRSSSTEMYYVMYDRKFYRHPVLSHPSSLSTKKE